MGNTAQGRKDYRDIINSNDNLQVKKGEIRDDS